MLYKKIITGVLAIVMAASAVGCKAKKAKDDEIVQITWCMVKPIENMDSLELVEKEINSILRERVGAELKLQLIDSGSWEEKINLMITSGEKFDLLMTNEQGPASLVVNSKRNGFMDIKDLLDKYGSAIKEKVDPRAWDSVTIDGQVLLVPCQGKYVGETAYVFKKDLVEKYGFDYKSVKSLKDLEPYCEILKQNEPDITPLYITAASGLGEPVNENYTNTSLSFVKFDETADKFISGIDAGYEQYKILNDFYKKGYIAKDAFVKTDSTEGKSGKYAVLRDTGAYTADGSKSTAYYGFPCVEVLVGRSLIGPTAFSSGTAISATSENPEKAMQVLNAVWEDPYLSNTLAYGIEGIDYEVVSGTTNEDKSVLPNSGNEQKWVIWHNWVGPLFDQWDSTWNSKEALNQMEENNKNAELSKAVGFIFDTSEIEAEVAALSEIHNASKTVLQVGSMEDFDTYMNELRAKQEKAGMDKLLEEINNQYAEWKANK